MPGLDPGIHRAAGTMDPRIKSAGDALVKGTIQLAEKKKVALVTGAAGTMGLATSKVLLEDGYAVALGDIDEARLISLAKSLGPDAHAAAFDVSDFGQAEAAIRRIEHEIGPIDVLVNNAGILSNNKV